MLLLNGKNIFLSDFSADKQLSHQEWVTPRVKRLAAGARCGIQGVAGGAQAQPKAHPDQKISRRRSDGGVCPGTTDVVQVLPNHPVCPARVYLVRQPWQGTGKWSCSIYECGYLQSCKQMNCDSLESRSLGLKLASGWMICSLIRFVCLAAEQGFYFGENNSPSLKNSSHFERGIQA